jgi:hypothetical protein
MAHKRKLRVISKVRYILLLLFLVVAIFVVPALIPRAHGNIAIVALEPITFHLQYQKPAAYHKTLRVTPAMAAGISELSYYHRSPQRSATKNLRLEQPEAEARFTDTHYIKGSVCMINIIPHSS